MTWFAGSLHLDTPPANMTHWQEIIRKLLAPRHRVRIGVVGKYIEIARRLQISL